MIVFEMKEVCFNLCVLSFFYFFVFFLYVEIYFFIIKLLNVGHRMLSLFYEEIFLKTSLTKQFSWEFSKNNYLYKITQINSAGYWKTR